MPGGEAAASVGFPADAVGGGRTSGGRAGEWAPGRRGWVPQPGACVCVWGGLGGEGAGPPPRCAGCPPHLLLLLLLHPPAPQPRPRAPRGRPARQPPGPGPRVRADRGPPAVPGARGAPGLPPGRPPGRRQPRRGRQGVARHPERRRSGVDFSLELAGAQVPQVGRWAHFTLCGAGEGRGGGGRRTLLLSLSSCLTRTRTAPARPRGSSPSRAAAVPDFSPSSREPQAPRFPSHHVHVREELGGREVAGGAPRDAKFSGMSSS